PFPGARVGVWVYPPNEMPYLVSYKEHPWPTGALPHQINVTVLRGILVHGTVVEAGNALPVAGAAINHEWNGTNNPFYLDTMKRRENPWPTRGAVSGPDGRFSIVVPPGPGFLI